MRHPLGEPAGIDEDERGTARADKLGETIVDLIPHLVARHRAQFARRDFDAQIHLAPVSNLNHTGVVSEKTGHEFDRLHGGRQADPLEPASGKRIEAGQTERQVRAALVVDDGVNFVDDHGPRRLEHLPALLRGQQDEQRLGRRNQDVRRARKHPLAVGGESVTGAERGPDGRKRNAPLGGKGGDFGERRFQVLLDVVTQRFERRDVDHLDLVEEPPFAGAAD